MTMAEVIDFISRFAVVTAAPVRTQHRGHVGRGRPTDGYPPRHQPAATSTAAPWCWRAAPATLPSVPALRQAVPASIPCFTPFDYRNPDQLPDGGVLIVGASATGVQLADEIHRSGRPVTLVGRRARPPAADVSRARRAVVDGRVGRVEPALRRDRRPDARARKLPSPQLVGTPERSDARSQRARAPPASSWSAGCRRPRRPRAVLRRAAQSVCAGRPQDGSAARHLRRVGADAAARSATSRRPNASSRHARAGVVAARVSICGAARSAPSSGPPGFVRTTAGSTCRWSIDKGLPAARRRRRRRARAVCDRAARPAAAQVDVHPRRRRRRARRRRSSGRLP